MQYFADEFKVRRKLGLKARSYFFKEFDSGSGLTLAVRLIHASRALQLAGERRTGEYKMGTCLEVRDNSEKSGLIPHMTYGLKPQGASRGARPLSASW